MKEKKITFEENLNNSISYYNSMVELLTSINKPTTEEKIQIKIYQTILKDFESLKRHYNYEKNIIKPYKM